jgi:protein phosphatase
MTEGPHSPSESHSAQVADAAATVPPGSIGLPEVALSFAGLTHVGLVRSNNEDQFLIVRLRKSLELLETSLPSQDALHLTDREGHVILVADGIGGRAGGERASAIAVQGATEYLLGAAKWFFRLDDPDEAVRLRLLREGLDRIDHRIMQESISNPALKGMGTTLTAASVVGAEVFIVHVGDSRAYVLHDGELRQLTTDHTLTQQLVEEGLMSPEQARTAPLHNILTNALGGRPGVSADIVKLRLYPGDRLLLCTDGLTENVSDKVIAELLKLHSRPAPACQGLIDAALFGGGTDNVTVVVAAAD